MHFVNRVDNLLCILLTTLSVTVAIERTFQFTNSPYVYNRPIKDGVIYDQAYVTAYAFTPVLQIIVYFYLLLKVTLIINFWYSVMINSCVGDMVSIY